MKTKIDEFVSVVSIFDKQTGEFKPAGIKWNSRYYKLTKLGYHHKIREGDVFIHIFSMASDSIAFKLQFKTDRLTWRLEEIYEDPNP